MRIKWKSESNPQAGTAVYLVGKKWMDTYKSYIFYRELQNGRTPQLEAKHCEENWPGQIKSSELLYDGEQYLKGTGTDKDFEAATVDTYLRRDVREM